MKRIITKDKKLRSAEVQYLSALEKILRNGQSVSKESERTGTGTKKIHNWVFSYDMSYGFPALTTKKLAWNSVVGELIAFLEGADTAERFRELGCPIWDANANQHPPEETGRRNAWLNNNHRRGKDHLGRVYGVQSRNWKKSDGTSVDQFANLLEALKSNDQDRRMFVSHANVGELDQMCLPPCHMSYQLGVMPKTNTLDLTWYQRSADAFLGVPFNIASYGLLLELLAKVTGHQPGILTGVFFDLHIYNNHSKQVQEQLTRKPYAPPALRIDIRNGEDILHMLSQKMMRPDMFTLENYQSHPLIKAPMAI